MALCVIEDGADCARLYCTTSETRFGPEFDGMRAAMGWLQYVARKHPGIDVRLFTDVEIDRLYVEWLATADGQPSVRIELL